MARKDTLVYPILTNQSLAANFNSPATIVRDLDNCSYQINIVTSNSTGTFNIQASNDYTVNATTRAVTNPGTWVNLPLGGSPVAAGANDTIMVNLNQLPFNAIRINYVSSAAGTGTCSATLVCRQIGG